MNQVLPGSRLHVAGNDVCPPDDEQQAEGKKTDDSDEPKQRNALAQMHEEHRDESGLGKRYDYVQHSIGGAKWYERGGSGSG